MNVEQTKERDEFVVNALQQAYREIEILQRYLRRQVPSASCTMLMLSVAVEIMGEE